MKQISEEKIDVLLKKLTLEEKIGMIHGSGLFHTEGVERLEIPPLITSDGPMGVRNEFQDKSWRPIGQTDDYVTYLPSNTALAATWNTEVAYETGRVLGSEARGRGKDVILAPGINIQRSPLCGRNFEYMSEDPKLIEEIAVPLIQGIQEYDVAACVKHFAANNQETERLMVDTYMDARTLREIYLPGFYASIKRGNSYTLMGAYNRLYGEHCSESKFLLNRILREEWGYDGVVISDWGAVHNTKNAAESALDIEMSVTSNFNEYFMADPLLMAVKNGEVDEAHIDEKVKNILRLMYRLKMLGDEREERSSGTYNTMGHREATLRAAREAVVLLKNEENRLPIQKKGLKTIAVIGQNAEKIHSGGGGSAEIKALYEISPLMGIKKLLGGNVKVEYAKGYYIPTKEEQREENLQESNRLLKEAVELAKRVDEVIIIGGLNHDHDCEGHDREDIILPYEQDRMIQEILEVNKNAVVVMLAGSPVSYRSFADRAKAIVWSSYIGMEGGTALAEVLFGEVNPSGKLPVTFPKYLEESPAHVYGEYGNTDSVTYKEGLMVGYRYYDSKQVEPEFCFGHGLSYTNFEYKNVSVDVKEDIKKQDISVSLDITIKNTGERSGFETIQIYIVDKEVSVFRPEHELKAFKKVFLEPGEERNITITLDKRAFAFFDANKECFAVEPGAFIIEVAASSRDIRLWEQIRIKNAYTYE